MIYCDSRLVFFEDDVGEFRDFGLFLVLESFGWFNFVVFIVCSKYLCC